MRAYVSQLICHFGRIWRICIGLFCAKRFLGLSVPSSMGPSVPSFHGVASLFTVSNSLCLFDMFFKFGIKGQSVPPTGLGTICAQHLGSCERI